MAVSPEDDPELEDLLGFFDYSYRPGQYTGSVVFHIKYPDGAVCEVCVEAQDQGVTVTRGAAGTIEHPGKAVHCSMDRDVFVQVYFGTLHPRTAIMANQIQVRRWRYLELNAWSQAFDFSSAAWDGFYAWKRAEAEAAEERRRQQEHEQLELELELALQQLEQERLEQEQAQAAAQAQAQAEAQALALAQAKLQAEHMLLEQHHQAQAQLRAHQRQHRRRFWDFLEAGDGLGVGDEHDVFSDLTADGLPTSASLLGTSVFSSSSTSSTSSSSSYSSLFSGTGNSSSPSATTLSSSLIMGLRAGSGVFLEPLQQQLQQLVDHTASALPLPQLPFGGSSGSSQHNNSGDRPFHASLATLLEDPAQLPRPLRVLGRHLESNQDHIRSRLHSQRALVLRALRSLSRFVPEAEMRQVIQLQQARSRPGASSSSSNNSGDGGSHGSHGSGSGDRDSLFEASGAEDTSMPMRRVMVGGGNHSHNNSNSSLSHNHSHSHSHSHNHNHSHSVSGSSGSGSSMPSSSSARRLGHSAAPQLSMQNRHHHHHHSDQHHLHSSIMDDGMDDGSRNNSLHNSHLNHNYHFRQNSSHSVNHNHNSNSSSHNRVGRLLQEVSEQQLGARVNANDSTQSRVQANDTQLESDFELEAAAIDDDWGPTTLFSALLRGSKQGFQHSHNSNHGNNDNNNSDTGNNNTFSLRRLLVAPLQPRAPPQKPVVAAGHHQHLHLHSHHQTAAAAAAAAVEDADPNLL